MNQILAFALVIAMTVAAVLGVKWQQATRETNARVRQVERGAANRVVPARADNASVQEIRRLEAELQNLRNQMANQRDSVNESFRVQVELLKQENASLHTLISNQMVIAASLTAAQQTVVSAVEEAVPDEEEEEDPGVGVGVVGMNEFRLMNWRQGTLPTEGAAVIDLAPGGTAMGSGLQLGDIITSMDGEPVNNGVMFEDKLSQMAPGRVTTLEVDRDRAEVIVQLLIPIEAAVAE